MVQAGQADSWTVQTARDGWIWDLFQKWRYKELLWILSWKIRKEKEMYLKFWFEKNGRGERVAVLERRNVWGIVVEV